MSTITEQQSREAFERYFNTPMGFRNGSVYSDEQMAHKWYGWQAAIKFAQEQQAEPSPQPPEHYHLATDEERKCLPDGTMFWSETTNNWARSSRIGKEGTEPDIYICPKTPELVSFTDGKLNPPPHGEWVRESMWTEETLNGGWRPGIIGEKDVTGELYTNGMWHRHLAGKINPAGLPFRTRSPLPPAPTTQPEPAMRIKSDEQRFQEFIEKCKADYKELTGKEYPFKP